VPGEPVIEAVSAVPFVDLRPSHAPLREAILADVAALIDAGSFTNGWQVAAFEEEFARYCGADFCIGFASGLDALRLALIASDLQPGDEVIVPANTFVASLEAVTQAGGRPVLVDVREDDCNLDAGPAAAAVSERTRFLLPVHLYGQMADMAALGELAASRGLGVLEDACQAHGASRDGVRAGSGSTAAFSFYPAKNLGAFGDAGALVTPDEALAERLRALREHGQTAKYHHELEGWTARLDTIQAIALLHKLPHLDRWNDERRAAAASYRERLTDVGDLRMLAVPPGSEPVYHVFVVRTADPVALGEFLRERGIGTGRHYPEPAHLSPAYEWLGYRRGMFPVTEALADEVLSLPLFPGISEEQLEAVSAAIEDFFRRS
jgi:dTDP-4-amino-4,6-dideoxygalactose transaminase